MRPIVSGAEEDRTWHDRTLLTAKEFGELLLLVTYGMAMGSPLSPVLAILLMEDFERKAMDTAPHRPKFWGRYVDDTGVVNQREHEKGLIEHINNQHSSIKFTIKREKDGRLPMLDVMMICKPDNSITTDMFRKETHTDHYLLWSSNHSVHQKLGIVRTLMHRANTLIEDHTLRAAEKEKVREALHLYGYLEWALKEGYNNSGENRNKDRTSQNKERHPASYAVLPFIKGVTERLKRAYSKHNASLFSKPGYTLRNALIIDQGSRKAHRKIKEAVHIQFERVGMNRNEGWELAKSYLPLLRKEAGEVKRSTVSTKSRVLARLGHSVIKVYSRHRKFEGN
ncbi:hypothetical protein Bbelb_065240 [Branchiostoma belcheri]|nr:hypothetical protein Bbelb_065240 [Branchiostoma belcheri]